MNNNNSNDDNDREDNDDHDDDDNILITYCSMQLMCARTFSKEFLNEVIGILRFTSIVFVYEYSRFKDIAGEQALVGVRAAWEIIVDSSERAYGLSINILSVEVSLKQ